MPSQKIKTAKDVDEAIAMSLNLAKQIGFSLAGSTMIATAVSELSRNVLIHAKSGIVKMSQFSKDGRQGIEILVIDKGPGIADISKAMQDNYSTAGGLGIGLPGAKRLVDEFELESKVNEGTQIIVRKWL